jgi:Phage phiEco32-like COOH.NH2 ligase-type 2
MLSTIGTDTEIFAVDKKGIHRSLCGKIGGSKDEPLQIKALPKGFCVQEDNVSLEFNIPPAANKENFTLSILTMVDKAENILKAQKLLLSKDSSASFIKEELSHPNALVFGCEPDYDAWKLVENPKPYSEDESLRTCGGHIHVGTQVDMITGIKNMDLFLGIPSIILDTSPSSIKRRELYGKAGAMRPKPYGFEYRTLSNFWVFDEKLIRYMWDQTYKAMISPVTFSPKESLRIQKAINKGDKDAASDIIRDYGLALPI